MSYNTPTDRAGPADLSRADSVFISKEEYIPYVFAEGKVRQMAADMTTIREKYEKHIAVMTESSNSKIAELKEYYDNYIKDMKRKALHHLDLQQKVFDGKEQLGRLNLQALEDRIEELLDLNSKNRLEFQERIKVIERESDRSVDQKMTCGLVLREMCDELERREAAAVTEEQRRQRERAMAASRSREMQAAMIRKGVGDSLQALLHQLDMDSMHAQQQETEERVMAAFVQASGRENDLTKQFEDMKAQSARAQEERERQRDESFEARLQEMQDRDAMELLARDAAMDEMRADKSRLQSAIADLRSKIARMQVEMSLAAVVAQVELREVAALKAQMKESDAFISKLMTEQSEDGAKHSAMIAQLQESKRQCVDLLAERDSERQRADNALRDLEQARSAAPDGESSRRGSAFEVGPRQIGAVPSAADPVPLHLRLKLQALQDKLEDDTKREIALTEAKSESKHELKAWLSEFEANNGRPADNQDKEVVKDKFENQKNVSDPLSSMRSGSCYLTIVV